MNYLKRKLKKAQKQFAFLFRNTAFYLQGQMDIHPESIWYSEKLVGQTGGFYPKEEIENRQIKSLEPWDNTRRDMIVLLLRTICEKGIKGDFAELGVYRGYTARLIHQYAPERILHLFDTFEGFPEESMKIDTEKVGKTFPKKLFTHTTVERVKKRISSENENVSFYQGFFPDTIPSDLKEKKFAFIHLDADLYQPTLAGLEFFYSRMSVGGFMLIHDYNAWIGARKAVDEFFNTKKEIPIPLPDKSGSVLIQVQ